MNTFNLNTLLNSFIPQGGLPTPLKLFRQLDTDRNGHISEDDTLNNSPVEQLTFKLVVLLISIFIAYNSYIFLWIDTLDTCDFSLHSQYYDFFYNIQYSSILSIPPFLFMAFCHLVIFLIFSILRLDFLLTFILTTVAYELYLSLDLIYSLLQHLRVVIYRGLLLCKPYFPGFISIPLISDLFTTLLNVEIPTIIRPWVSMLESVFLVVRMAMNASSLGDLVSTFALGYKLGLTPTFDGASIWTYTTTKFSEFFIEPAFAVASQSEATQNIFSHWRDWMKGSESIPKFQSLFKHFAALTSMLAVAPFLHKLGIIFSPNALTKMERVSYNKIKGIDSLMDYGVKITDLILYFLDGIVKTKDGNFSWITDDLQIYSLWYKQTTAFIREHSDVANDTLLQSSNSYLTDLGLEASSLVAQSDKLVKQLSLSKDCHSELTTVRERTNVLLPLLREIERLIRIRTSRRAPLCISIFGAPGVGKTNIVSLLVSLMSDLTGKSAVGATHDVNSMSKYWENLFTNQWHLAFDDPQTTLPTVLLDEKFANFVHLANNVPCLANKAALNEKGKESIQPDLITVTTNVADFHVHDFLSNPSAVMRRFAAHLVITLKPEWTNERGTLKSEGNPIIFSGGESTNPFYFGVREVIVQTEILHHFTDVKIMNLNEFTNHIRFLHQEGEKQQDKFLETQSRLNNNAWCSAHGYLNCIECYPEGLPIATMAIIDHVPRQVLTVRDQTIPYLHRFKNFVFSLPIHYRSVLRDWYYAPRWNTNTELAECSGVGVLDDINDPPPFYIGWSWWIDDFWVTYSSHEKAVNYRKCACVICHQRVKQYGSNRLATNLFYNIIVYSTLSFVPATIVVVGMQLRVYIRQPLSTAALRRNYYTQNSNVAIYEAFLFSFFLAAYLGAKKTVPVAVATAAVISYAHVKPMIYPEKTNVPDAYFQKALIKNKVFIEAIRATNRSTNWGLCLADNVVVVPTHAIKDSRRITLCFQSGKPVHLSSMHFQKHPSLDLAVCFSSLIGPRTNILKFLRHDLYKVKCDSTLLLHEVTRDGGTDAHQQATSVKEYIDVTTNVWNEYYNIERVCIRGNCGSMLYKGNGKNSVILGMLTQSTTNTSFFTPLLRPDMDMLIKCGKEFPICLTTPITTPIYTIIKQNEGIHRDLSPTYPHSALHYAGVPDKDILGTFSTLHSSKMKSKIVKSQFYTFVAEEFPGISDYVAPVFTAPFVDDVRDNFNSPTHFNIRAVCGPKAKFDPVLLDKASHTYYRRVRRYMMDNMVETFPMSTSNAVYGVHGFEGIHFDTSAGFPYSCPKNTIMESATVNGHPSYKLTKGQLKTLHEVEEIYARGGRVGNYAVGSFKDEVVKAAKQLRGKLRVFCSITFYLNIIMRKQFGSLMMFYNSSNFDHSRATECCIGMQSFGHTWSEISATLERNGKISEEDITSLDKSTGLYELYIAWRTLFDLNEGDRFSDRDRRIQHGLILDIVLVMYIFKRDLLKPMGTNASGNSFTTIINSVNMSLWQRVMWADVTGRPVNTYDGCNDLFTYGDDTLSSTCDRRFTSAAKVKSARKFNLGMTTVGDGQFLDISEVSFLKRKFLPYETSEGQKLVLDPIDPMSIAKMLSFVGKTQLTENEHLVAVFQNAILENSRQPPQVQEKIERLLSKCENYLRHNSDLLDDYIPLSHEQVILKYFFD